MPMAMGITTIPIAINKSPISPNNLIKNQQLIVVSLSCFSIPKKSKRVG